MVSSCIRAWSEGVLLIETIHLHVYLVVLVTCPTDSVEKISDEVLNARLAACVNSMGVHSRYWWKGRIHSEDESLLLIKTRAELFDRLEETINRVHPYEVPEVVGLNVESGSRRYLDWMMKETKPTFRKARKR